MPRALAAPTKPQVSQALHIIHLLGWSWRAVACRSWCWIGVAPQFTFYMALICFLVLIALLALARLNEDVRLSRKAIPASVLQDEGLKARGSCRALRAEVPPCLGDLQTCQHLCLKPCRRFCKSTRKNRHRSSSNECKRKRFLLQALELKKCSTSEVECKAKVNLS